MKLNVRTEVSSVWAVQKHPYGLILMAAMWPLALENLGVPQHAIKLKKSVHQNMQDINFIDGNTLNVINMTIGTEVRLLHVIYQFV